MARPTSPPAAPAPAAVVEPPLVVEAQRQPVPVAVERTLLIGGTAIGVALGLATAVRELFLTPLHIGSVPLPLSPILAVLTCSG